jgi:hypothetical protein
VAAVLERRLPLEALPGIGEIRSGHPEMVRTGLPMLERLRRERPDRFFPTVPVSAGARRSAHDLDRELEERRGPDGRLETIAGIASDWPRP